MEHTRRVLEREVNKLEVAIEKLIEVTRSFYGIQNIDVSSEVVASISTTRKAIQDLRELVRPDQRQNLKRPERF
jgi:hypothetical protein